MEYADQGSLSEYLTVNKDTLTWKTRFQLALDICNGLSCMHKEKILHRDLVSKLMLTYLYKIYIMTKLGVFLAFF